MISKTVVQQLIDRLGKDNVVCEPEELPVLGYDATPELHHAPD